MRKLIVILIYVFFLSVVGAGCRDNFMTPEAKDNSEENKPKDPGEGEQTD